MTDKSISAPNTIKILTYNIHKGFSIANRRFTLFAIREALEDIDPDVIFLQELQGEHHKRRRKIATWPLKPQGEFLAENLWPFSLYAKNAVYKKGHHGNGLLCKFPIISWQNTNLSKAKFASRSYLHAKILLPNQTHLNLVCIHLGLFEAERESQLDMIAQTIEQTIPEDESLIMAGDFNDWRKRALDHMKIDLGLKEAFLNDSGQHARTFPVWRPTLQVDRIYYRGLELQETLSFRHKRWRKLSDHLPIGAIFKFPDK
ncbi:endonuclease/exonuclease/phosphatase family protein [sulfur-oxidizing endosymbiont of Gigantopelta aegis]|uniref:endonuclease/exonuclease/phosphatase family protein n=1 Tax=sulfur-oxidizing endosymbiont of Gigantopelta aegis TaxID=2794934 RepID=UPI001FEBD95B|nr:endonuclease/exonuclease/phosphatase family protein [sulfur-oxidizing endosymbiont of Gigantopelta aegis]